MINLNKSVNPRSSKPETGIMYIEYQNGDRKVIDYVNGQETRGLNITEHYDQESNKTLTRFEEMRKSYEVITGWRLLDKSEIKYFELYYRIIHLDIKILS